MTSGLVARQRLFKAVLIGVSTGGVDALKRLLSELPADFAAPIVIVIHIAPNSDDGLAQLLDGLCDIRVKEADEGEQLAAGIAYIAPANYHLLVEADGRLALNADAPVQFARPSIDVLFESFAAAMGPDVIGVVLTGAASDGAAGLQRIQQVGGWTIIQDPSDAAMDSMPKSALARCQPDRVVQLNELPGILMTLIGRTGISRKDTP